MRTTFKRLVTVFIGTLLSGASITEALRINHKILFTEAKKYLLHAEFSVSEIAYRLNFEDPAYFTRFLQVCRDVAKSIQKETRVTVS